MEPAFASSVRAVIVAHQGGWDEVLLIAGPILVIALLLTVAKRRVDAARRAAEAEPAPDEPT